VVDIYGRLEFERIRMKVRCVTHGRTFSESFDARFHESLNAGCKWESVGALAEETRGGKAPFVLIVAGSILLFLLLLLG